MINLAVYYNNLGVDILSGTHQLKSSYASECKNSSSYTNNWEQNDCIHNVGRRDHPPGPGEPSRKRRKLTTHSDYHAQVSFDMKDPADRRVDDALACFQKSLALIVQDTESQYYGNGLRYHPNDDEGFLRYDNEAMRKQLVSGTKPCDTGITLKGEEFYSNEYIYWKAVKIGSGDAPNNDGLQYCNSDSFDGDDGQSTDNDNRIRRHFEERLHGEYKSLAKSIYHSMICIFNIGLCYHYKGMIGKARHMKLMTSHANPCAVGLDFCNEYCDFLNASIDHYTQAYELMTRFRLEDTGQYTFLMAMMNNLAATYGSLGQTSKVEVCNRYLVQSLTLVICSSERDGHLGQDVLSRTENKSMLRKQEDRTTFELFLSNVMHLMLGDDRKGEQRYNGKTIAAAA
eukprot:jgi/Psemu1/64872/estExt_Genemark1.C_880063